MANPSDNRIVRFLGTSSVVLATACVFRQLWHRLRRHKGDPPLVLGWLPWIGAATDYFADPLGFLRRMRDQLGDTFTVRMAGTNWTFVLSQQDCNEFELLSERKASLQNGFINIAKVFLPANMRESGVGSLDSKYKEHKVFLTSALKQINHLMPVMRAVTEGDLFGSVADEATVDIFPFCYDMISGMTLRCLVGPEVFANGYEGFQLWNGIFRKIDLDQAFCKGEGGRLAAVKSMWEYAFQGERHVYKELYAALGPIVERHREAALQGKLEGMEVMRACIRWRLGNAGGDPTKVTKKLIANDVMLLSMASISNSAMSAAWVLSYNLRDPELRRRQQQEFDDIFGSGDNFNLSLEGLERCTLLQATILEVIRLKNSGSSLRLVMEDLHFSSGLVVPAGHMVATSRYFNCRDPAYFADPEVFDVDRHMPGSDAAAQRACAEGRYAPWGRGTHACLGRRFVNIQIALFVALLWRNFEAELVDPSAQMMVDPTQAGWFISRPVDPVLMKLRRLK